MSILESKVYRTLEVFTNFLLLNLLWLAACLPVVTAFPATAAMFAVVREWTRKNEPSLLGFFFSSFKRYFWRSLAVGVPWALLGVLLAVNFTLVVEMEPVFQLPLYVFSSFAGLLYVFTSVYLFPTMVGFEMSWSSVVRNSFLLSVTQPLITLSCMSVMVASVIIFLLLPASALVLGSVACYTMYRLCDLAFKRVTPTERDDCR